MRYILIASIFGLFLSTCSKQKVGHVITDLPDSIALNNVISSLIYIDSIWTDHNVNKQIKPLKLYNIEYVNGSSIPPDPFSISYEELYSFFNSTNDSLRALDSIYLSQQINNHRQVILSDSIVAVFNIKDDSYYEFYLPLFSHDKKYVYVFYARECGPLCGTFFESVLIRKDEKWYRKNFDIVGGR